jgi:hypothetical protein
MDVIYKVGVVIGIIAIYSLVTWGFGAMLSESGDDLGSAAMAWLFGAIFFLILAIFTMEKFGLWM